MTVVAKEPFSDLVEDIKALLPSHWEELALYKDDIPLDADYEAYAKADAAGFMSFYTARENGVLVAYALFFVIPRHMHYRHRWAKNDIIWVAPSHRNGRVGVKLIRYAEKEMRSQGPIVIHIEIKDHAPELGRLLKLLGYDKVAEGYSKRLG